ncbi:MAG: hypothetical protein LUD02_03665 [Tannerellaceae bacterium]|nr:hypothetical protein [Tannerellaceae bacterium]MCD8263357.1 hypothetical protein [Tannerellaceae bacterium]
MKTNSYLYLLLLFLFVAACTATGTELPGGPGHEELTLRIQLAAPATTLPGSNRAITGTTLYESEVNQVAVLLFEWQPATGQYSYKRYAQARSLVHTGQNTYSFEALLLYTTQPLK